MRKFDLLTAVLILASFVILLYKIDKPFWGQFDWNGAWFGTIARNYLQIDVAKTRLAPITDAGTTDRTLWTYYNHYQITYPLIIAGSMAVFGDHEWSIRLVSVIFSALMLAAFYVFCRRFFHPLVGIFGILCILVTPMFIYYGKLPVYEQAVLFFSLIGLYFYLLRRRWPMLIFLSLAFMMSWTGAYILVLITIHLLWYNRRNWRQLIPSYFALIVIALLHFLHISISSDLSDFSSALAERTSSGGPPIVFLVKQTKWFMALYTKPLAAVAILSLILHRKPLLLMFFCWGFFEWFVVNRIAWIHDFMLIHFLPFVALSTGLFFWKLVKWNKLAGVLTLLVTLGLSLYLSLPFTVALLNSKDQTGEMYPVGKYLKENSVYGDKILVAIKPGTDFEIHYPVHYFSYYSDRYVKYQFVSAGEIPRNYKYIIAPLNYSDPELLKTMDRTMKAIDFKDFRVYETR